MFIEFRNNPCGRSVGDCAIRAIARALDVSWETAYRMITKAGLDMCDMPSSDSVWGAVLRQNGFYRKAIPNTYPIYYTAEDMWRLMDELMSTLQVINPRLYNGVMRKIED